MHKWDHYGSQADQQQGHRLKTVAGKNVVSSSTKLGTKHISQRPGDENNADLVERAGCVFSQPW